MARRLAIGRPTAPKPLEARDPAIPAARRLHRVAGGDAPPPLWLHRVRSPAEEHSRTIHRSSPSGDECAIPPAPSPALLAPPATPRRVGRRCLRACHQDQTKKLARLSSG